MEAMTIETAAALFRACESAMLCTQGGRVAFANPAAIAALGEDPTGKSAASVLPERLLKLQGKLGAASAKIRNREAVVTVSRAGLYKAYSLRFLLPSARGKPQHAAAAQLGKPAARNRLRWGEHHGPVPCRGAQIVLVGYGDAPGPALLDPAVDRGGIDVLIPHAFSPFAEKSRRAMFSAAPM